MYFFHPPFGCPTANFGPFFKRQPHSPDVNHYALSFININIRAEDCWESFIEVNFLRPDERLVGFEAEPSDSITTP